MALSRAMYLQATIISASSLKPLEFNNKTAFNRRFVGLVYFCILCPREVVTMCRVYYAEYINHCGQVREP